MFKIIEVKTLPNYVLWLKYSDGVEGTVDVSHLAGKGAFARWSDASEFERVQIGDSGELVWEGDLDLCPDALYLQMTGKKAEEVFPKLTRQRTHA